MSMIIDEVGRSLVEATSFSRTQESLTRLRFALGSDSDMALPLLVHEMKLLTEDRLEAASISKLDDKSPVADGNFCEKLRVWPADVF